MIKRLWYIARKYFRMNPFKLWWVLHVIDEWKVLRRQRKSTK